MAKQLVVCDPSGGLCSSSSGWSGDVKGGGISRMLRREEVDGGVRSSGGRGSVGRIVVDIFSGGMQKEKGAAEGEMVRWYHRRSGREFEQTLGDSGQRSLARSSPWGCKELDVD